LVETVEWVQVSRQTAIDALALGNFVMEVVESKDHLAKYLDGFRERTLAAWARQP
jgi:hypothetical protein